MNKMNCQTQQKSQWRQNLNTKWVYDMLQELPRDNISQAMVITMQWTCRWNRHNNMHQINMEEKLITNVYLNCCRC
jgi:hypothetical protein